MKTTVRITLKSNGNSQDYKFATEQEARNFFNEKRMYHAQPPVYWTVELIES